MGTPELPQAQPSTDRYERTENSDSGTTTTPDATDGDATFERLIESHIESHTAELRRELEELEREVEEIENFAKISLNERKIKQSEENLSEFSDSLSSFAETSFNHINALEERMDLHALLLAAMLESLDEEEVELDLEQVRKQREDRLVMDQSPRERLAGAIERF